MSSFPTSSFTTSRGFTCNYIHIHPSSLSTSYALFLHGFPSTAALCFRPQIQHFASLPSNPGILVPDLLGSGHSSKPTSLLPYAALPMATDVFELLAHEKITRNIVGVAHDWGCLLLSRLVNYAPEGLFERLVFLDTGYSAPMGMGLGKEMLRMVDRRVMAEKGYGVFGYFLFFGEEGAVEEMNREVDSAGSLFYSGDADLGKRYLGAEGGLRQWLAEEKIAEWPGWISKEDIELFRKSFSVENGGYGPAMNWYRAQLQNINSEDEKAIPQSNHKLAQPTLLLTGKDHFVSSAAQFDEQMKPFATDFESKELDCGHWLTREKPKEVNEILERFMKGEGI